MGKRLSAFHVARHGWVLVTAGLSLALFARPASAYRPFDGTDADVANVGEFELELGPTQWLRRANQSYVIAPAAVLNLGILSATEVVVDFDNFVALGPLSPDQPRVQLLDTDVLMKHVFREGRLQGGSGPSIAAEGGPLLPEVNGVEQFGGMLDVIVSQAWPAGTVHFNEQAAYSRQHNVDLFSGIILEGPHHWVVRPVSEFFYERAFNEEEIWSGLFGMIAALRDSLVLDAAVRVARIQDRDAVEVRFGFTWTLPVWKGAETSATSARR